MRNITSFLAFCPIIPDGLSPFFSCTFHKQSAATFPSSNSTTIQHHRHYLPRAMPTNLQNSSQRQYSLPLLNRIFVFRCVAQCASGLLGNTNSRCTVLAAWRTFIFYNCVVEVISCVNNRNEIG